MAHRFGKKDGWFIGGLLGIGLLIGLCLLLFSKEGRTVEVRVSGALVKTFTLDRDAEYLIHGANGGTNLLRIQNGEVWVEEASCPDGLCMGMGPIAKAGQSIICLPNEVVIEITGANDESVDIVTGGPSS